MSNMSTVQETQRFNVAEIYGDARSVVRIFYFFIALTLFGLVSGIFIVLTNGSHVAAAILAAGIPPALASLYLVKHNRFEIAAILLAVLFLFLNTSISTNGLGIHSVNNLAFPAILIIASLVAYRRTMFFLVALTVVCVGWLVFGELWGFYSPGVLVNSVPGDFLSASLIVILTSLMVQRLTGEIYRSFSRVRQEALARKTTEENLRQRETILETVTFAAEQFLKSSDWRSDINTVLERLGRSLGVSHTYLYEHHLNVEGVEVSTLRYEWTAPGFSSDLERSDFQNSHPLRFGGGTSDDILRGGDVFMGNTSTFPLIEKDRLAEMGVKAMLEVPLFVNGAWWGTIGFDDMTNEREWSPAEIDALRIAAGILSAAIRRELAESAVRESERIYRQAISAAGAVPYYQDYQKERYTFFGEGIRQIAGIGPGELTPQAWDDMVQEFVLLGELAGLNEADAIRRVRAGETAAWKCDYRILTPDGQSRWVADTSVEVFTDQKLSVGSIGIMQDITDRKRTEAALRQREAMLAAVTFSAGQFLNSPDWRSAINVVLERLGREFNASHAYLFEKHPGEDGKLLNSLRYEWAAPGQASDMDNPAYQNAPTREAEYQRYYEILDSGEPFVGSTATLRKFDNENAWMESTGIKALLEMRIVVDGKQWGTLGFDDMVSEREWTGMEVDVLRVAVNVLGAAIKRQMDQAALQRELDERRRAEQALRFSEEKFSKAFHTTPVMMTLEDGEGRFIEVNNAFLETMGYERDEIIGHRPAEFSLIPATENQNMTRIIREKGGFKAMEVRIRRKSGEVGTVLMSIEDIRMNDTVYMLTSALDITERKRAEQKYRDIFNNSIDGIFQSTEDGRFLNVNPAMARIYGYESPEAMLQNVDDIVNQLYVHPENRDEVRRRLSAGERLIGFENLDYRRDGSTFWSSMSAQAIFDETGEILYYEGTVEDITPRKKAEAEREALIQELAKKNAESETLRETTSIVASTLDVTEAVQRILEQLKRAVPYDSASVWLYEGRIARMVGSDGLPNEINIDMEYAISELEPDYPFVVDDISYILLEDIQEHYPQFREPPGNYIHGWLSVALRARRKLIGFISLDSRTPGRFTELDARLALNFANQVAVALENARLFSDLQKELEERKKLIEELAKKNAELEQFTYTVSHDLKSPLVTINGFLGYLEQDMISGNMERLKRDTLRIQEAVYKMQRLLNELLELSRIGRLMNASETIPFGDLIREALEIVHGRLEERGVVVHIQPDLPAVYGDRPRLVEVIQNLVDNAAKYMGAQERPRIEIGQRGEDPERGFPIFHVRDNGIGIPPEHHERIFGLFNKLDARSEGTGVGLALVRRIIEVHGGRIWVESEAGTGSTFLFSLPTQPPTDSVI